MVPNKPDLAFHFDPQATALTIAGSDPSGGAGLQADLKVFQQLGVYGMTVVTLLTVQNTQTVSRVEVMPTDLILQQLDAVMQDIPPKAIKIGALGNADVVQAVGERLAGVDIPIVVDPVLVSKHGHALANDDVVDAYRKFLFPIATVITPNRLEAARLSGLPIDDLSSCRDALRKLVQLGAHCPMIKYGAVDGKSLHLLSLHGNMNEMEVARFEEGNQHGSGCVLAATIAAYLAQGATDILAILDRSISSTLQAIGFPSHLGSAIHPAETRAIERQRIV